MLLVFMLDALRHDYVTPEDAPFLHGLAQAGVSGSLVPTFGFEPDYAFLAGLFPDEANGGMQFVRTTGPSAFRTAKWIPSWCDALPRFPQKVIRTALRRHARRRSGSPFVAPAMIPFSLLPEFDVAMSRALDEPNVWSRPSVFDLLRAEGRTWLSHWAPRWRVSIDAVAVRAAAEFNSTTGFAFFHVGDLDRVGHEAGPDSADRRAAMRRVDQGVRRVVDLARERCGQVTVLAFGDHGMVTVAGKIDVRSALAELPWREGKDYRMFLDSTLARFWVLNEVAREPLLSALHSITGGRVLSQSDRDRYHLNYSDNRFGEILFVADEGLVLSPNFYQGSERVAGMHGYLPEIRDQQAAFVLAGAKVERAGETQSAVDMRRLFPTLLQLLDLPLPFGNTLKPLPLR